MVKILIYSSTLLLHHSVLNRKEKNKGKILIYIMVSIKLSNRNEMGPIKKSDKLRKGMEDSDI